MFHPKDAIEHMRLITVSCEDITLTLSDMYLDSQKQVKALGQMIDVSVKMSRLYDEVTTPKSSALYDDKLDVQEVYHQWCTLYTKFLLYHHKAMPI